MTAQIDSDATLSEIRALCALILDGPDETTPRPYPNSRDLAERLASRIADLDSHLRRGRPMPTDWHVWTVADFSDGPQDIDRLIELTNDRLRAIAAQNAALAEMVQILGAHQ